MTEKVGLIKNPLTIIAIFAGIAEVSGTIVLPFVAASNQQLFIWFLIIFPTLLVVVFFATLNFNNKVLYAPSDYKDEVNYLTINKYNKTTQQQVEVKESVGQVIKSLSEEIEIVKTQTKVLETQYNKSSITDAITINTTSNKDLFNYEISINLMAAQKFINNMQSLGYKFTLYDAGTNRTLSPQKTNKAIWLGGLIPLDIVKEIILNAKKFYPFIEYISLTRVNALHTINKPNEIFIGGWTASATDDFHLKPISATGFEQIQSFTTLDQLHAFLIQHEE